MGEDEKKKLKEQLLSKGRTELVLERNWASVVGQSSRSGEKEITQGSQTSNAMKLMLEKEEQVNITSGSVVL